MFHFSMAKEMGLEAVGFLMMAHMRPPEFLAEQALLMQSYGADCFYIVDSAGALLPQGAATRVVALKQALSIQVGYLMHTIISASPSATPSPRLRQAQIKSMAHCEALARAQATLRRNCWLQ
jgi:hypothetical protein